MECPAGENVDEIITVIGAIPVPTCEAGRLTYRFNDSHSDFITVNDPIFLGLARLSIIFSSNTTSRLAIDARVNATLTEPSVLIEVDGCGKESVHIFSMDSVQIQVDLDYENALDSLPFEIIQVPLCSSIEFSNTFTEVAFQDDTKCEDAFISFNGTSAVLTCPGGIENQDGGSAIRKSSALTNAIASLLL